MAGLAQASSSTSSTSLETLSDRGASKTRSKPSSAAFAPSRLCPQSFEPEPQGQVLRRLRRVTRPCATRLPALREPLRAYLSRLQRRSPSASASARTPATDRLNGLRVTPRALEDARQDAWGSQWLGHGLRHFLLQDRCGLSWWQFKQAPWREVMTLILSAGLLDLNRERLRIALHFMCRL